MSRIAKYPVPVPDKVQITVDGSEVTVKGPLGTMKHSIGSNVLVKKDGDKVTFAAADESKLFRFTIKHSILLMVAILAVLDILVNVMGVITL